MFPIQFYAAVCVVRGHGTGVILVFFGFIESSIFGTVYLFVFGLGQLIGLKNYIKMWEVALNISRLIFTRIKNTAVAVFVPTLLGISRQSYGGLIGQFVCVLSANSVSAGQLLCSGLFSSDGLSTWFASVALLHAIIENCTQKEQLLRVQLATRLGHPPVSLLQQCTNILTQVTSMLAGVTTAGFFFAVYIWYYI